MLAALQHFRDAIYWFNGTDQHGICFPCHVGNDIKQSIEAINQVHISHTAFMIHDLGAGGAFAGIGMASHIVLAAIGFCFHYSAAGQDAIYPGAYILTDQIPGDLHHVGMYVGNGWIVHASQTGVPIKMAKLDSSPVHSFGRPG